ncbi:hypothetical protein [Runella sp.]|uniref:hypothetical protein n=1 Tax=Runella sp. TaxID=1960881 RepID=UPI003D09930B
MKRSLLFMCLIVSMATRSFAQGHIETEGGTIDTKSIIIGVVIGLVIGYLLGSRMGKKS